MLEPMNLILQDFEISHYGFLPVEEPLRCLPDHYYEPWESIITRLPHLIENGTLYERFDHLPLLTTEHLSTTPEWRRAYVILTFFAHAHIWTNSQPHQVS